MAKLLRRAVPTEDWELVLEFDGPDYRLFSTSILYKEKGWHQLAYPQHLKHFTLAPDAVCWPGIGTVDAQYLYRRSAPLDQESLERRVLRLSYQNQAPTSEDASHHVYGVYLARFGKHPFRIGESIGGGIAERGGGYDFSLEELLRWPNWKQHFELSGCSWAVPMIESGAGDPECLLDALVSEACRRNGTAEDLALPARLSPPPQSRSLFKRIASITSASAREFWRRLG